MTNVPNMARALAPSASDYGVSALRAALGAVPLAGSLLSEIITIAVPNQRLDRLAIFAERLAARLAEFEVQLTDLTLRKMSEPAVALLEEGARTAVKALSKTRIDQIAILVAKGLNGPEDELEREKDLVELVDRLSDIDVLLLSQLPFPLDVPVHRLLREVDYWPQVDPAVSDKNREREYVAREVVRRERIARRALTSGRLLAFGLIRRLDEVRTVPATNTCKVAWPIEWHEFEHTELGHFVLWRLGLMSNGLLMIDGTHNRPPSRYSGPTEYDMILMLDCASRTLNINLQEVANEAEDMAKSAVSRGLAGPHSIEKV